MALGAESAHVLRLIIRTGVGLVALGTIIGLIVSLSLGHVMATQLWGVSAYDPLTLVSVVLLLLATGVVACGVPARRVTKVDPLVALRYAYLRKPCLPSLTRVRGAASSPGGKPSGTQNRL